MGNTLIRSKNSQSEVQVQVLFWVISDCLGDLTSWAADCATVARTNISLCLMILCISNFLSI